MTFFITGATGFIGYNLTDRLLKEGHNIIALRRQSSQNYVELLENRVVFVFDNSIYGLADMFVKYSIDCVIHLASLLISEHKPEDVAPLLSANVILGTNILEAMRLSGCKYIINTGTGLQYYNNENRAACLYGATKEAFQKILDFYTDAYDIGAISLEISNSYGKNDYNRKLLPLLKNAYINQVPIELSLGEQYIDLLHIDDVVAAFTHGIGLLRHDINERYMVTGNRAIQIKELIAIIEKILCAKLPVKLCKPYRAREIFVPWTSGTPLPDWQPKVSLEDGLKEYFTV